VRTRLAGTAAALAAAAALGTAYFVQDVLLMVPCELCLWERWPYRIAIGLGILAALLPPRFGKWVLGFLVLVFCAGAAIAFVHIGVEQKWWLSPLPECNGILTLGAPLPLTPAIPCDNPVFIIPHLPISMATMDFVLELILTAATLIFLIRERKYG